MSFQQTYSFPDERSSNRYTLGTFFEFSPHLCCIIGPDFSFTELNQAWTEELGWSCEELFAGSLLDSVDPDTKEVTISAYQSLELGKKIQFQNRHLHKRGGSRSVSWHIWQDNRKLTYGIGIIMEEAGSLDVSTNPEPQADSFLDQQLLALQSLQANLERQKLEPTVSSQVLYDISFQSNFTFSDEALLQSILEDLRSAVSFDISGGVFLSRTDEVWQGSFFKNHGTHLPPCKFFINTHRPLPRATQQSIQETILKNLAYLSGVDLREAQLKVNVLEPQAVDPKASPLANIQSQLFVPLIVPAEREPKVIGLLFIGAERENQFSEEHVRLLYFAASHVAMLAQRLRSRIAIDQLAQVIKNLTDGVLLLDQQCRIILANGKAQNYLALLSEMDTDNCLRRLGSKTLDQLMCCSPDDVACREITLINHPERVFEASIKPISTDSHVECWVVVIRDISERKRFEAKIQLALENARELVALKSRVIRTVSHEYRSPLAVIRMAAELLETKHQQLDTEQSQHFLRRIQETIDHMTELVDDMLLIEQTDSGRLDFTPIQLDLKDFCQRLVNEHRLLSNHNHSILFSAQGACTQLYADPKLLRQIISNLITNAIKYSPDGGSIRIQLIGHPKEAILSVEDEGIGIPPEVQSEVFEPFYRAENVDVIEGSGLGLNIVKKFVEMHGGHVNINSQVNEGTKVTVQFPTQTEEDNSC